MARKISIYFLSVLSFSPLFSQLNFNRKFEFLQHLEKLQEWEEGILQIRLIDNSLLSLGQRDTLSYFKGKFHYQKKEIDLSVASFSNISNESPILFDYSKFYTGFQYAFIHEPDSAFETFKMIPPRTGLIQQLKNMELAGVSLLKRDHDLFQDYRKNFTGNYQLQAYEKGLISYNNDIQSFKPKSPFIAGLLSAVFPGAGRFYIGKPGEGIATILVEGIFALQTLEGIRKDGIDSFRAIFFGSLLTVSHIANIWGTSLAVSVRRNEFNDQIDDSILLDMHIPIRTLLD